MVFLNHDIDALINNTDADNMIYGFWFISQFAGGIFEKRKNSATRNVSQPNYFTEMRKFDQLTYFTSADSTYWKIYGERFIRSLGKNVPCANLHAHIIDPTREALDNIAAWCRDEGINLNLSTEMAPVFRDDGARNSRKTYYASIRFVRLFEVMNVHQSNIVSLDIDSVLLGDLGARLEQTDCDVLVSYGAHIGPWREFSAAMLFLRFSEGARLYAEIVRNYIVNMFGEGRVYWTLDQAALYCSYIYLKEFGVAPKMTFADDNIKRLYFSAMGGHREKESALNDALATVPETAG